jgi:hypothetical protein
MDLTDVILALPLLEFQYSRVQATAPLKLMPSGRMACDGLRDVQLHSKQGKIHWNVLPHDLYQLIRHPQEISNLIFAQTHTFWWQATPHPLWCHQAEWLAHTIWQAAGVGSKFSGTEHPSGLSECIYMATTDLVMFKAQYRKKYTHTRHIQPRSNKSSCP